MIDVTASSGKNVTEGLLCAEHRARDKLVICVFRTGIAAFQRPEGWTAHSIFKLPLRSRMFRVLLATFPVKHNTLIASSFRPYRLGGNPHEPTLLGEALDITLRDQ